MEVKCHHLVTRHQFPIELPADGSIQGALLHDIVAQKAGIPSHELKLVHNGATLSREAGAAPLKFQPNDVILVLRVAPLVSERIKRSTHPGGASTSGDDDDASDLKFTIPADLPAWQRAVARFLQRRAKLPDLALAWIFQIGLNRIMCLLAFLALAPVAARFELGPIFVLTAIIAAIFTNLGKRREGEASGYSIFNDGVQRLPGEMINAEALDQQLRRGELMR